MNIHWTNWITFRNLYTQLITEYLLWVTCIEKSWIIPLCLEEYVNFTQICKLLLLFWSYAFEQETIYDSYLANTFQRYQYYLSKIPIKSLLQRNSLCFYMTFITVSPIRNWQYTPTCPRYTGDTALSKNKLLRKLCVLLFFLEEWLKDFLKGLVPKQRF